MLHFAAELTGHQQLDAGFSCRDAILLFTAFPRTSNSVKQAFSNSAYLIYRSGSLPASLLARFPDGIPKLAAQLATELAAAEQLPALRAANIQDIIQILRKECPGPNRLARVYSSLPCTQVLFCYGRSPQRRGSSGPQLLRSALGRSVD
jgi:hypothetical protein